MRVSLDGGLTYVDASQVDVFYELADVPGGDGSMCFHLNEQGVEIDILRCVEPPGSDANIGTSRETIQEVVRRLTLKETAS